MSGEIVLALGQHADKGECGSCERFDRRGKVEHDNAGYCRLKLPPNRVFVRAEWDAETAPLEQVDDTNSCSFWISDGKTYIVSERIKP